MKFYHKPYIYFESKEAGLLKIFISVIKSLGIYQDTKSKKYFLQITFTSGDSVTSTKNFSSLAAANMAFKGVSLIITDYLANFNNENN